MKIEKRCLKFVWSHFVSKIILSERNNGKDNPLPDFKLYYRVTVIKQHSTKARCADQ